MNLLVIDGNSIINRAFYGIKILNARDGHFTNAIHGFMSTFLNLLDETKADGVAVAFDVHEPTFRHKMYDGYKAGRRPMPPELFEQMEPLKDILRAYGCHIVECPGYEADDILGTLAASCKNGDSCCIATGDRDSLQLISDNTAVYLTVTKMGKTVTTKYTKEVLFEEYGLTPDEMIELKALQGDTSDKIPGVPGIGPKTAIELIKNYKSIDNIYENIDTIKVTPTVRNKLVTGKDSAYFSKTLGTISRSAPIDTELEHYKLNARDDNKLLELLSYHELFKIISKIGLSADTISKSSVKDVKVETIDIIENDTAVFEDICKQKRNALHIAFEGDDIKRIYLTGDTKAVCFTEEYFCADLFAKSEILTKIFNSDSETVVVDAKNIYAFCLKQLKKLPEKNLSDISLAAYLLDPNASSYGVSSLSMSYKIPEPENIADDDNKEDTKTALLMLPLYNRLHSGLESNRQVDIYRKIELPLARVLAEMEKEGIAVIPDDIKSYGEVLEAKAQELTEKIYELAGEKFNINSPKQLGVVLFEKLGIPCKKKTKTGYSTNADVLGELAEDYPIVSCVLEYRTFAKLKSTYCDGLLKSIADDGRIHCSFNQTETRTGRLSSAEPNLQNIPVRTPIGKEFRKFFTAKDGFVIVDADYSQIELRVLAALSHDKNMTDAFNSDGDIHTLTASKVFGIPVKEVTPALRSKAKAVNFGIVYGIGGFSLSKDIHSTRAEAESFINSYLALYSSVDEYMKNCIESAKTNGYAETLFSRRRYLPELVSSNRAVRMFGERVARNMPIQGTAADIIKIAMIKVSERLKKELPEAALIMQVHDELMVEAPEEKAEKAAEILKSEMENAAELSVKLKADVGIGKTWYEAKS